MSDSDGPVYDFGFDEDEIGFIDDERWSLRGWSDKLSDEDSQRAANVGGSDFGRPIDDNDLEAVEIDPEFTVVDQSSTWALKRQKWARHVTLPFVR